MNEFAKKWVAALRSGKYAQGRNFLRRISTEHGTPDAYCCLGVACDLYAQDKGGEWAARSLRGPQTFSTRRDSSSTNLPLEVGMRLGLVDFSSGSKAVSKLIDMNDRKLCSFEEIASFIERNEKTMFDA